MEASRNRKIGNLVVMLGCFVLLLFAGRMKVEAAAQEVTLTTIARPGEMETFERDGEGLMILLGGDDYRKTFYYSFTVTERCWVLLDSNLEYWTYSYVKNIELYKDAALKESVDYKIYDDTTCGYLRGYYLDAGTYYLKVYAAYENNNVYGYVLPVSSIMTASTQKVDCSTETLRVDLSLTGGTTVMREGASTPEEIKDSDAWKNATKSLTDTYEVTSNGSFTVKVTFTDSEWEDYPMDLVVTVSDLTDHTYQDGINLATTKADGNKYKECSVCGYILVTKEIPQIASVELGKATYGYTGKEIKPSVTVKDSQGYMLTSKFYTVTYENNKKIGKGKVTIEFKGNYSGTVTKTFKIQLKKGTVYTVGNYKYKATSTSKVAFAGLANKKITKVTIPKTVKIGGQTCKVTSIADNALKGTKVQKVTVGENVTSIGEYAFANCKKLKKMVFKRKKLKSIGWAAFYGDPSIYVDAPTDKLVDSYINMMNNAY